VDKKHFMGSFNAWAVTYNDAGSGPLHMEAAMCTASLDDINGSYVEDGGRCAFGGGADKIFIVWSGKGTDNVGEQGTRIITGGPGKHAGIQGKFAYNAKPLSHTISSYSLARSNSTFNQGGDDEEDATPALDDDGRDYDPEDTLRFYGLRLREAGLIQTSPNKLIAEHTDWRFLDEIKRELKA
jgi:hypothetical protein